MLGDSAPLHFQCPSYLLLGSVARASACQSLVAHALCFSMVTSAMLCLRCKERCYLTAHALTEAAAVAAPALRQCPAASWGCTAAAAAARCPMGPPQLPAWASTPGSWGNTLGWSASRPGWLVNTWVMWDCRPGWWENTWAMWDCMRARWESTEATQGCTAGWWVNMRETWASRRGRWVSRPAMLGSMLGLLASTLHRHNTCEQPEILS